MDIVVDSSTRLDRLLRRSGVQAWRIPLLIAGNAVWVMRERSRLTPIAEDTRLQAGDFVRIVDPLPSSVAATLQREVDRNARDLAFVPGTSAFDLQMRFVLSQRPATQVFADPLVDSLRSLIQALARSDQVTQPIRHVILASHANPEGLLFMKLDSLGVGHITYEDLEQAVSQRYLEIANEWLNPRPHDAASGNPVPAQVLIRGCRIGRAPPYLRKLKEALGNRLAVVAPKHFHVVARQSRPAGGVEYMDYGFTLARPEVFANRAGAIAAFTAGGFSRVDGTPVPSLSWNDWVPRSIRATSQLAVRAVSPITGARDQFLGEFRVRSRQFLDQEGSVSATSDPGSDTARKRVVGDQLVAQYARYQTTHPFPEYVRYGHATMDEFMDSWTWQFRYDAAQRLLHFNAARVEYTVVQPIINPSNGQVFVNFYPSGSTGTVIEQLSPTDARFFEAV